MDTTAQARKVKRKTLIIKQRYLYFMLLPAVIMVLIFAYIPLAGWIIAFINYKPGMNLFPIEWTGLRQFKMFFSNSNDFQYLIRNTLAINIGALISNLFTAFVFSLLLNEIRVKLFGRFIQTVTFFPFFVSWVIIYSFSSALFAVSSGAINETLINWGILEEGINLLGDAKYAWVFMILLGTWKSLGYNSVIFIASIAAIPSELYEAAEIDGANRFQKVWHITIPAMVPTLIVLLILNSGWILNSNFDQFYLFTNPTNWEMMEVLDLYIYKYGLQLLNFPYATAVGILKTFVSIGLILVVNTISKKATGKAIF